MNRFLKYNFFTFLLFISTFFFVKAYAQYFNYTKGFMQSDSLVGPAPSTEIPVVTKNGPTPLGALFNFYNPWVAKDDTNSYNSYKLWTSLSWAQRVALSKQLIKEGSIANQVDSLKAIYGTDICPYISTENQIRIGQLANKKEFIKNNNYLGEIDYTDGGNKIKIPVFQFSTSGGEKHFINGIFVGDSTGKMDELNLKDYLLFSSYTGKDRIGLKLNDFEIGNGPVSIGLEAYVKYSFMQNPVFDDVTPMITWNLKDGKVTSTDYSGYLVINNPNLIKVNAGTLGDINVDGTTVAPADTDLTLQYLKEKGYNVVGDTSSSGNPNNFPINISYVLSDRVYSPDSSNFTQGVKEYAWIYKNATPDSPKSTGGIVKVDSTEGTIVVNNLIPTNGKLKIDSTSLEQIALSGGDVPTENSNLTHSDMISMGYNVTPKVIEENMNLPVTIAYTKSAPVYNSDSTQMSFDFTSTATAYSFGDTAKASANQNVTVTDLIGPHTNANLTWKTNEIILDANKIQNGKNLKPSDLTTKFLQGLGYDAFPDTINKNIGNLKANYYYTDSAPVYSTDSSSFSFDREAFAKYYSLGKTKIDSTPTPQKISLENITAVENPFPTTPREYNLSQNYPNPFNPSTTINYSLPKTSYVKIVVYNLLGKNIKTLVSREQSAGNYNIVFNASKLSSGVYLYKIQAGQFSSVKKFIVLK